MEPDTKYRSTEKEEHAHYVGAKSDRAHKNTSAPMLVLDSKFLHICLWFGSSQNTEINRNVTFFRFLFKQ